MVAALRCNERQRYAAFVERFSPELVQNGQALRSFFRTNYGTSASNKIDRMVTRLANEASHRSLSRGEVFCYDARELFQSVLDLEVGQLGLYASVRPFATSHGVPACDTVHLVEETAGATD
jgi:hypothetical protein